MLKNSYGFSRCLFYSIQIEAVCCWEVAVKCEDESLIGCMVEPPFYIADKIEEFEDCFANAELEFTQTLTCWRFGDWMHQLRGSLLLTVCCWQKLLKLKLSKDQRQCKTTWRLQEDRRQSFDSRQSFYEAIVKGEFVGACLWQQLRFGLWISCN